MRLKTLKISSIAAIALGLGLSSMAQAAVVIVTGHRPPPPVYNCVYKPYNNTVYCYGAGYRAHIYHPYNRVCIKTGPSGYCTWKSCFQTINGLQCYNPSGRLY
jgi:hypothetical protein